MRVRIVTANGCMAHVRDNPREGRITEFVNRDVYCSLKVRYAVIQLDSGDIVEKPANERLWNVYDGLPEYQE